MLKKLKILSLALIMGISFNMGAFAKVNVNTIAEDHLKGSKLSYGEKIKLAKKIAAASGNDQAKAINLAKKVNADVKTGTNPNAALAKATGKKMKAKSSKAPKLPKAKTKSDVTLVKFPSSSYKLATNAKLTLTKADIYNRYINSYKMVGKKHFYRIVNLKLKKSKFKKSGSSKYLVLSANSFKVGDVVKVSKSKTKQLKLKATASGKSAYTKAVMAK